MYFESNAVKSDCPVQNFRKMMKCLKILYRLLVYHTSFTVFLDILIKNFFKKSSENEKNK